jgi:hypothetical protein
VGVVAALALGLGVVRYYKRSSGTVTHTAGVRARLMIAFGVGMAVFVTTLHLGRALQDGAPEGSANAQAVAWGLGMLTFHLLGVGLRAHHLVIWGVVIGAGLLPVWAAPPAGDAAALLLMGGGVVVSGALDHRLFVRTLARARNRVGAENVHASA